MRARLAGRRGGRGAGGSRRARSSRAGPCAEPGTTIRGAAATGGDRTLRVDRLASSTRATGRSRRSIRCGRTARRSRAGSICRRRAAIDVANRQTGIFPVGTRFWKEFTLRRAQGGDADAVEGRRAVDCRELRLERRADRRGARAAEGLPASPRSRPAAATASRHAPIAPRVTVRSGRRRSASTLLQLSPDRDPNAIHGEPLAAGMVTLGRWCAKNGCSPLDRTL